MKPTDKQIKAIDTIIKHLNYWKDSNDIETLSHIQDIMNDLDLTELNKGVELTVKILYRDILDLEKPVVQEEYVQEHSASEK